MRDLVYAAVALAIAAVAHGADRLRAHYQVDVREGTDVKTVQTTSEVESGRPIEHALTKYRLSLLIDVGDANAYVLTVSLARLESPGDVLVKGSFNGSMVGPNMGPLEFDVEKNGVRVSGAIALSHVGQSAPPERKGPQR